MWVFKALIPARAITSSHCVHFYLPYLGQYLLLEAVGVLIPSDPRASIRRTSSYRPSTLQLY